jgi:hypothetical protein
VEVYFTTEHQNRGFAFAATPDTGATRLIFSFDLVRKQGLKPRRDTTIRLQAANGEYMRCQGTIQQYAHLNGQEALSDGIVSSDLEGEVLLSWHDMQNLGIIPRHFPSNEARAKRVNSQPAGAGGGSVPASLEEMKTKFADVLGTTLDEAAGAM